MADGQQGHGGARPGHVAPADYDASAYPQFAVTVDIVILTMRVGALHVLLVERADDPFAGSWALPGGFKQPDETLDEAAARELAEETAVPAPAHLAQFRSYGDPGRDPRMNVVTTAYLAVVPYIGEVEGGTDATAARVWAVSDVLDGTLDLAFDHERIVRDALDVTARELEQAGIAPTFLGPTFTLTELQSVYEAVWNTTFDAANFRRALATDGEPTYVEPTGDVADSTARGGRPPKLFRAGRRVAARLAAATTTNDPDRTERAMTKPSMTQRAIGAVDRLRGR
jgi:8-oxo-dGTP diphosphatase